MEFGGGEVGVGEGVEGIYVCWGGEVGGEVSGVWVVFVFSYRPMGDGGSPWVRSRVFTIVGARMGIELKPIKTYFE